MSSRFDRRRFLKSLGALAAFPVLARLAGRGRALAAENPRLRISLSKKSFPFPLSRERCSPIPS